MSKIIDQTINFEHEARKANSDLNEVSNVNSDFTYLSID